MQQAAVCLRVCAHTLVCVSGCVFVRHLLPGRRCHAAAEAPPPAPPLSLDPTISKSPGPHPSRPLPPLSLEAEAARTHTGVLWAMCALRQRRVHTQTHTCRRRVFRGGSTSSQLPTGPPTPHPPRSPLQRDKACLHNPRSDESSGRASWSDWFQRENKTKTSVRSPPCW